MSYLPKGSFKTLWATEESIGYEINVYGSSKGELNITIPTTLAHLFKRGEKVKVIIEKITE